MPILQKANIIRHKDSYTYNQIVLPYFILFYVSYSQRGPRFMRAFAGYKGPACCIPFLVIVRLPRSGMVSQTIYALCIFYFAAVKRSQEAPPSATSHGVKVGFTRPLCKSNVSLHWTWEAGGALRVTLSHPPWFITVTRRPHPSSHLGPRLMDYFRGRVFFWEYSEAI